MFITEDIYLYLHYVRETFEVFTGIVLFNRIMQLFKLTSNIIRIYKPNRTKAAYIIPASTSMGVKS